MGRNKLGRLTLAALAGVALASPMVQACTQPRSPLFVVIDEAPKSPPLKGRGAGLIATWVSAAFDRDVAADVAALHATLPALDRAALAITGLECVGIVDPKNGCRSVQTLSSADESALEATLQEQGDHCALVALVSFRLASAFYATRIELREFQGTGTQIRQKVPRIVAYVTRVPEEVLARKKKEVHAIEQYWQEGQPSRLEAEARGSIGELRDLLGAVMAAHQNEDDSRQIYDVAQEEIVAANSKWQESAWPGLQEVKSLQAAGRYHCRGLGGAACRGVRLLRERGERSWLVGPTLRGAEGAVSLDRNAARYSASVNWVLNFDF